MGNQPSGSRGRGQTSTSIDLQPSKAKDSVDGGQRVERRHSITYNYEKKVDSEELEHHSSTKSRSASEGQSSSVDQAVRSSLKDECLTGPPPSRRRSSSLHVYNALGKKLGGSFTREPEHMLNESTQQCELTTFTQQLLEKAFTDIDPNEIVDYHVHIVGHGDSGSGCFIHETAKQWYRPFRRLKTAVFMTAAQVPDMEGGDIQYVSRLVRLVKHFVPSCGLGRSEANHTTAYQHGKLCILAFDGFHIKSGEYRSSKTTLYVPNDYVLKLSREFPEYFIPVGSVNPYRVDALDELQRCADNGVTIIKWLPNSMGINPTDEACVPFYSKMKELDLALLIHVGEEHSVTAGFIDNSLGNPLFMRKPLDYGVKVIAAHCATEGSAIDTDSPMATKVPCFQLFMRLMKEDKYKGLLFGDISAVCGFKRVEYLKDLLDATDIHDRLVYGSDYPVPAINLVVHTSKLRRVGLITPEECTALNELYNYNPLLFDFVSKRLLRGPKGGFFPPSVFKAHPLLPPYRTVTKNPKLGTSVDPCDEKSPVNEDSQTDHDLVEESLGDSKTGCGVVDEGLTKKVTVETQVQVEVHYDILQDVEIEPTGSDQSGMEDSRVLETVTDCIADTVHVPTDHVSETNTNQIDETVVHNHQIVDTLVENQSDDHSVVPQDTENTTLLSLPDEAEGVLLQSITGGSTSNNEMTNLISSQTENK